MEVTYGLLSNLVKTKAIGRVLAPIASQVGGIIIEVWGSYTRRCISVYSLPACSCNLIKFKVSLLISKSLEMVIWRHLEYLYTSNLYV